MRKYALDVQLCVCIDQLAVLHVNQKCEMSQKSAPRMGFRTSAMMKIQGSVRLRPRLSVRVRLPYVRIEVLFTAVRVSVSEACRSVPEGGMTLTSKPCIN